MDLMILKKQRWLLRVLGGLAALGWVWALLQMSGALARLAASLSPPVLWAGVVALFALGAFGGGFLLREPRASRVEPPPPEPDPPASEHVDEHPTEQSLPAAGSTTKEYF
jgi:hypothetical protein